MADFDVKTAPTEFLFQRLASPRQDDSCCLCWEPKADPEDVESIVCQRCVWALIDRIRKLENRPSEIF